MIEQLQEKRKEPERDYHTTEYEERKLRREERIKEREKLKVEREEENEKFEKRRVERVGRIQMRKKQLLEINTEECVICFEHKSNNKALVPCGHTNYCNICIDKLENCAVCRGKITSVLTLY
jgi:hypothetical protein